MLEARQDKSDSEIEEYVLSAMEQLDSNAEDLLTLVQSLHADGRGVLSESLAETLQSDFNALADKSSAVALWRMRSVWHIDEPGYKAKSKAVITELFKRDPLGIRVVRNAGWDDQPLKESVRRVDLLFGLKPGRLCLNKTWGAGVVKRVDEFYEKVAIDFKGKPGHELSFAYACEGLELLDDDHLLARRHRNADEVADLAKSSPGELVKVALASFGDMPVAVLQETLAAHQIVTESGWKKFWEGARRELKQDPSVDIPTKRSERVRLLAKPKAYDAEWAAVLLKERGMKTLLERITEAAEAVGVDALEPAVRDAFANRLAFVLLGAANNDGLFAAALLMARRFKVEGEGIDFAEGVDRYFSPEGLIRVCTAAPARDLSDWFALMWDMRPEETPELIEGVFKQMTTSVLSAACDALMERGETERVAGAFRKQFSAKVLTAETLLWLSKRMELVTDWKLGRLADVPVLCMDAMQVPLMGDRLRARQQLGQLFEDRDWLRICMDAMTDQERSELLARVKTTISGAPLDRGVVVGRIMGLYENIREASLSEDAVEEAAQPVMMTGMTSWRSYRERQAELKELVEVEVPKNSQELAVAAGYGDLRENHEYKSAKELQGILMQRMVEAEEDLRRVQGTDFEGFKGDRVGMGTSVRVDENGTISTFCILGEWDRDEERNVISSASGMAEALAGRVVGDTVDLPSEAGDRKGTIVGIDPLSAELRAWASGD